MIVHTIDEVNHWRDRAIAAEEKVKTLEAEIKRLNRLFGSMEREIDRLQSRDDHPEDDWDY